MDNIIFDIETGGLPKDVILPLMPKFEAPANYSNPESILKHIQKKEEEWLNEKTALSAITGEVLAIGYQKNNEPIEIIGGDSEKDTLNAFWEVVRDNPSANFIGFYSNGFDIPFLVRRSWKNGVFVPNIYNGRYLQYRFIDLLQVWSCGTTDKIKLDQLAKYFGVGAKNGDGAEFSKMWKVNRQSAIEYLKNDIAITKGVAVAMGLVEEDIF